ncbi:MAG: VirB3 family type IV secretion system protein [Rickettsiales bacterium]
MSSNSSGSGRLQSDPLFQGLTRPTMILGVSFMYFVLNAVINIVAFINTQNFVFTLVVAPIIHVIGYWLCLKEPRTVEMLVLKMSKGFKCTNKNFHNNNNSYDPF